MRELKFRIWSNRDKRYLGVRPYVFCVSTITSLDIDDDCVIEQFTGLYDGTTWDELSDEDKVEFYYANKSTENDTLSKVRRLWRGKEVYQGDIIDLNQIVNGCNLFEIVWDKTKWNARYAIPMITPRNYEYNFEDLFTSHFCEDLDVRVVGNIHEVEVKT